MKTLLKQSKKHFLLAFAIVLLGVAGFAASPQITMAQVCPQGQVGNPDAPCSQPEGAKISKEPCKTAGQQGCDATFTTDKGSIINDYINPLIKLMTVIVGVVIVIMVVIAGIQYSSAGGDPSGVAAAKQRITNAVIALIAYVFALGFLQWLVPGGLV